MRQEGPSEPEMIANGLYELLYRVQAREGSQPIFVGEEGPCRYCGQSDRSRFRTEAHTIPRALGNRWIFSVDECDDCNALFGAYDRELVNAVGAILTLGGTRGNHNDIRQTGRSAGRTFIRRDESGDRPRISIMARGANPADSIFVDRNTGHLMLRIPVPPTRFIPEFAYKALVKMAYGSIPASELGHYRQLREWLQNPMSMEDFPILEVAASFASIGNAPHFVVGTLLRRVDHTSPVPHILFELIAGSLCLVIDLKSDSLEDHIPPRPAQTLGLRSRVREPVRPGEDRIFEYTHQHHLNWGSKTPEPQPFSEFLLEQDVPRRTARLIPVLGNRQ